MMYASIPNHVFSNIALVVWNWPWWECLYYIHGETLQIRSFFLSFLELTVKHSQHYWLQVVTWDYIFLFDRQIPPFYGSVSLSKPTAPPYPLDQFCLCRLGWITASCELLSSSPTMTQATISFCLVFFYTLVICCLVSTLALLAFFQSNLHTAAGVIFKNCKTFTQAGEINKIKGEIIQFKI